MNEPIIIEELGKIWGRDAIYLDKIKFEGTRKVILFGTFNGSLCENIKDSKWVSYELTFTGLLEFRTIELDLFPDTEYTSSFERVIDSARIKKFSKRAQNKLKDSHEHFIFHTYDDVIEVIANGFEIKLIPKK